MSTGTHEILNFIKLVISSTSRPAWLNTVPVGFGESKTGTLKADEWRSLSTIFLPIALVLLWGDGSKQPNLAIQAELSTVLEHTMHLVQALCLSCYRTTSDTRATRMHEHLRSYVGQLLEVFTEVRPVANQHMALHLGSFMQLFGPVHSWWTYPFERLIGRLQKMPTNNKTGWFSSFRLT